MESQANSPGRQPHNAGDLKFLSSQDGLQPGETTQRKNENNLQNDQMRSSGVGVPGGSSPTKRLGDMR